jgi:hypothetical protein
MLELEALDGVTYPATTTEIAAACGDETVSLPGGDVRLGDVFERFEDPVCRDAAEARALFKTAVGQRAIGREGYSDRDPPVAGAEYEPVSL